MNVQLLTFKKRKMEEESDYKEQIVVRLISSDARVNFIFVGMVC